MLVICEDCAKKYNIDETRIQGERAQFTCNGCGHIIVVTKPQVDTSLPEKEIEPEKETKSNEPSTPVARGKGIPIRSYIFLTMTMGFLVISAAFAYLYLKYIPGIIYDQIELRTSAISESFSGVITKPLLLRNYLQVNKEAQRTSRLPGAAYAAVINKKGIVVAGFFSDLSRFDREFEMQVKKKGFPTSVLSENKLGTGDGHNRILIGGQTIYDTVVSIPNSGGEVHVGIYVSEVDKAIRNALISPVTLSVAGAILLIGFIILFLLTRTITRPMQELTDVANRISLGELDLTISPRGPREMRELAAAFERMRFSIKAAVDRLRK
ncbi:MAG TPA: HAMP domain-containing protein [Desulfobacterales bacterium]|nr:HAMP domain-containing protein [Desulfobacterales bacterium]HIP39461.1 HAMP domain-containing protein [Desulfocapsa sulfexigens]